MKAKTRIFLIMVYKSLVLILLFRFISHTEKLLHNISVHCDET